MTQVLRRGKVLTDLAIHQLVSGDSPEHTLEVLGQLIDWKTEWGRYSTGSMTVEILESERQRIIKGGGPSGSSVPQPASSGSSEPQQAASGLSEPRLILEEPVGRLPPLPRLIPEGPEGGLPPRPGPEHLLGFLWGVIMELRHVSKPDTPHDTPDTVPGRASTLLGRPPDLPPGSKSPPRFWPHRRLHGFLWPRRRPPRRLHLLRWLLRSRPPDRLHLSRWLQRPKNSCLALVGYFVLDFGSQGFFMVCFCLGFRFLLFFCSFQFLCFLYLLVILDFLCFGYFILVYCSA
ncbi:hypothetical protein AMECASPLE_015741 [Ameca splendens]|uniref:Uncharacterized protein n=1 Tax=Ameca splendens TaxID=208324 RepID=A0ABV0YDX7_9TELE